MNWSEEEVGDAEDRRARAEGEDMPHTDETWRKGVRAIMTRAVELAAARGTGKFIQCTDCHEIRDDDGENACRCGDGGGRPVSLPASVGARVAVLEAELDLARKGFDGGSPAEAAINALEAQVDAIAKDRDGYAEEVVGLRERLSAAENGNRELVRRAQQAEGQIARDARVEAVLTGQVERYRSETEKLEHQRLHMAAEIIRLREQCSTLEEERKNQRDRANAPSAAGQVDNSDEGIEYDLGDGPFTRYPCSPTCTHDDAAKPGHQERVKERSEAVAREVNAFGGETLGARRALCDAMERLGFDGAAMFRDTSLDTAALGNALFQSVRDEEDRVATGATEAMRAACLSAATTWAMERGFSVPELKSLKSAIEGAVP